MSTACPDCGENIPTCHRSPFFHRDQLYNKAGGEGVTVIYVDTLFLLNAIIDYLLLLCSARVAGEVLCRWRFLLGAVVGGGYAVAIFLPGLAFLQHPLCRIAVAVAMVLVAFGGCRHLLRLTLIFFALSCGFGGGVLAISLLGGQGLMLDGGVVYSAMDLKIVLLSAAGCYCLLTLLFRRFGRHDMASGEIVPLVISLEGRQVTLLALRDTGNTLTDPISGRPVVVAEGRSLATLFSPGQGFSPQELSNPPATLESRRGTALARRLRILPYRAVGVEGGLLLAIRVDDLSVGQGEGSGGLVALSPTPVSDGGNYRALIGLGY